MTLDDARAAIEAEVARLISILDILDGDPDAEPDDEDCENDGTEPAALRPFGDLLT